MWFIQFFSGLAACAVASVWNPGQADVITDWNQVTLDVIRADQTPPPPATRMLAMVHIAMYEAVNGIHGQYEPYFLSRPAPPGASPEAAAATAAHRVLVAQYPDLKKELNAVLAESLAAIGDPSARQKGQAWGRFCGNQVVQWRRHDGADTTIFYEPAGLFGHWQPTPPDFAPALLPQWPYVAPFAIRSPRQFPVPPPPSFISPDYAVAFHEVKAYGDVDSTVRTADQTLIAYFWEDGPGTVTPPGHWQVIAQQLAERFGNTLSENARLFALLSLTQADGAIHAWYTKYDYDHVRPYTAIVEEADDDGNPKTNANPTWFNLIPTPPFPAYVSGHSTFSGGSSTILERFFGRDAIAFCGDSPDPERWPAVLPGVVRCWDSLSQAAEEAGQSRIYGGIHWQYDNQQGLAAGRAIAEHVFAHFLRPLD